MLKKFLFILIILFTVSCATQKNNIVDYGVGKYMVLEYDTLVTMNGFNNLCWEENINPNYDKWLKSKQMDYETRKNFNSYLFIKKMDTTEIRYRLIIRDNVYNLNKITTSNTK